MKLSSEDYAIHNLMEELVDLAIEQVIAEDSTACDCAFCRADMKCLVLNRLKAEYRPVAELEEDYAPTDLRDVGKELFDQLMVETHWALDIVKAEPRHEDRRSPFHNEMEDLVLYALGEILTHQQRDLSFDQISSVMALVLNDVTPRYTTTQKGSAFSRTVQIDPDYLARIYSRIYAALDRLELHV
ncbi:MAG: late competence development ComFB family protein [Bacillota bacterium]|nr:late competence development ComFB family protein [Bacillota bacterium]